MINALASGPPLAGNNFGDIQSDGIAGPVGLLIIVLLAIATVLLIRNMNSRIKRLPQQFPRSTGSGDFDAGVADRGSDPAASSNSAKSQGSTPTKGQTGAEPGKD